MNRVWCALIVAVIFSGCGGNEGVFPSGTGTELASPPPFSDDAPEASDPSMPEVHGGGTSAGNPILEGDVTAGGSTGEPIPQVDQSGAVQWQLVPFSHTVGELSLPDETSPASNNCPGDYDAIDHRSPIFLVGPGDNGDRVIDLYATMQELLGPLVLPLASLFDAPSASSTYPPYPAHVATDPKGGVLVALSGSIPFHGVPCAFFALNNALTDLTCVDPELTDFGILPSAWEGYSAQNWDTPPSDRRLPIQFDAEGNVYYRLIPPYSDCEGQLSGKEWINPLAQIRRWDRKTGTLSTYPLGAFLSYQWQIVKDGAVIVTGYDMAAGAGDALVVRYVLPDGTWYPLDLQAFGANPSSFLVVDDHTLLVSASKKQLLLRVPFDAKGFGGPEILVQPSDGLTNAEEFTFGTRLLYAQAGADGAIYATSEGTSPKGWSLPWAPRAIVKVAPAPPAFVETPASKVKFFRMVGDRLFVGGRDAGGKAIFFEGSVALPNTGVNLFGAEQHNVADFLVVGDHVYFTSGYVWKGPSYEFGRVDMSADHPVEVLATTKYFVPRIFPIGPIEQKALPLPPTDLAAHQSFPQVHGVGCLVAASPNLWSAGTSSIYLINMEGTRDTGFDLREYLFAKIWPEWAQGIYRWNIIPTHVATDPHGGIVFKNWRSILAGGWCDFFHLDPLAHKVRCIDPTAIYTYSGLLPEPWGQPPSLRRSLIQFDAAGHVYYRFIPPNEGCEIGVKEGFNPRAEIRRWDRETGKVTTYPLGDFLPLRFHVLADGGLIVTGFDRAGASVSEWPVLRYVLPDGSWHELALPSLGQADLPFHVTSHQTVLIPLIDAKGLFEVPFGPAGFGTPTSVVTAADDLWDAYHHWGMALAAPQEAGTARYVLDRGWPSVVSWWSGRNALLRLAPGKPALVATQIPNPKFFQVIGNAFYIVGDDAAGIHRFIRARLVSPTNGLDLLSGANIAVHDFLIRDQQIFFTGYQEGTAGQSGGAVFGRIDMAAGNALTILARPEGASSLYPYWPAPAGSTAP